MNTEKIVKETNVLMLVSGIVGVLLLGTGVIFNLFEINIIHNNRAIIGLSFIPLAVALTYFIKLIRIEKSPQKMRKIIISKNDERLVTMKNEVDAKAFRILQWVLFLSYMAYTLVVPKDIFESVGWWIILALLFISYILQGIMFKLVNGKNNNISDGAQ